MTLRDLIRILEQVREKRLTLLELAPQVLTPEGELDAAKALPMAGEIEKAAEETEAYINAVRQLRCALEKLFR